MILVRFNSVGRGKRCWTAELRDSNEETIAKEAKRALVSRDVVAEDGYIYAGMRAVGRYTIIPNQESRSE